MKDLSEYFSYDEESPSGLIWKKNRLNGWNHSKIFIKAGTVAGSLASDGYWKVVFYGKSMTAHRIIWTIVNGEIPEGQTIDHIDRNQSNNKIENLRMVSHAVNSRNRSQRIDNKTGYTGVNYFEPKDGRTPRYTATWMDENGKPRARTFSVGKYGENTLNLAIAYREEVIRQLNEKGVGYTETHGGPRFEEQEEDLIGIEFNADEYYYLSCILGHVVPAGKISKSLLDKVSTFQLDVDDFDLIHFKGDEIGGYSITINEEKE